MNESPAVKVDTLVLDTYGRCVELILKRNAQIFPISNVNSKTTNGMSYLEIDNGDYCNKILTSWKKNITCPLVLDVFLFHDAIGKLVLIERWTFAYSRNDEIRESRFNTINRRLVTLMRSLYSFIRLLPGHQLFAICEAIPSLRYTIYNPEITGPSISFPMETSSYDFPPISTSKGSLQLGVRFIKESKLQTMLTLPRRLRLSFDAPAIAHGAAGHGLPGKTAAVPIPIPSDKSSSSSSTSSPSKDATRNRAPSIDEVDSNQGRSYDSKPSSLKHTNLHSPGTTPTGGGSTSEQGSGGRPPRHPGRERSESLAAYSASPGGLTGTPPFLAHAQYGSSALPALPSSYEDLLTGVSPPFRPPSALFSTSPPGAAFSPLSVKDGLWRSSVDRMARESKQKVDALIDVQYRLRVLLPTPPFATAVKRAQRVAAFGAEGDRRSSRENCEDNKEVGLDIFDNFNAGDDDDDDDNNDDNNGFQEELPFALAQSDVHALGPFSNASLGSGGSHSSSAKSKNAVAPYFSHAPPLVSFQETLMVGDMKIDAEAIDQYIRELKQFRDGFP